MRDTPVKITVEGWGKEVPKASYHLPHQHWIISQKKKKGAIKKRERNAMKQQS